MTEVKRLLLCLPDSPLHRTRVVSVWIFQCLDPNFGPRPEDPGSNTVEGTLPSTSHASRTTAPPPRGSLTTPSVSFHRNFFSKSLRLDFLLLNYSIFTPSGRSMTLLVHGFGRTSSLSRVRLFLPSFLHSDRTTGVFR